MTKPSERDLAAADLILAHFQAAEMKQITWTEAGERVQQTVAQAREEEREAILADFKERHSPIAGLGVRTWADIKTWIVAVIEARGEEGGE